MHEKIEKWVGVNLRIEKINAGAGETLSNKAQYAGFFDSDAHKNYDYGFTGRINKVDGLYQYSLILQQRVVHSWILNVEVDGQEKTKETFSAAMKMWQAVEFNRAMCRGDGVSFSLRTNLAYMHSSKFEEANQALSDLIGKRDELAENSEQESVIAQGDDDTTSGRSTQSTRFKQSRLIDRKDKSRIELHVAIYVLRTYANAHVYFIFEMLRFIEGSGALHEAFYGVSPARGGARQGAANSSQGNNQSFPVLYDVQCFLGAFSLDDVPSEIEIQEAQTSPYQSDSDSLSSAPVKLKWKKEDDEHRYKPVCTMPQLVNRKVADSFWGDWRARILRFEPMMPESLQNMPLQFLGVQRVRMKDALRVFQRECSRHVTPPAVVNGRILFSAPQIVPGSLVPPLFDFTEPPTGKNAISGRKIWDGVWYVQDIVDFLYAIKRIVQINPQDSWQAVQSQAARLHLGLNFDKKVPAIDFYNKLMEDDYVAQKYNAIVGNSTGKALNHNESQKVWNVDPFYPPQRNRTIQDSKTKHGFHFVVQGIADEMLNALFSLFVEDITNKGDLKKNLRIVWKVRSNGKDAKHITIVNALRCLKTLRPSTDFRTNSRDKLKMDGTWESLVNSPGNFHCFGPESRSLHAQMMRSFDKTLPNLEGNFERFIASRHVPGMAILLRQMRAYNLMSCRELWTQLQAKDSPLTAQFTQLLSAMPLGVQSEVRYVMRFVQEDEAVVAMEVERLLRENEWEMVNSNTSKLVVQRNAGSDLTLMYNIVHKIFYEALASTEFKTETINTKYKCIESVLWHCSALEQVKTLNSSNALLDVLQESVSQTGSSTLRLFPLSLSSKILNEKSVLKKMHNAKKVAPEYETINDDVADELFTPKISKENVKFDDNIKKLIKQILNRIGASDATKIDEKKIKTALSLRRLFLLQYMMTRPSRQIDYEYCLEPVNYTSNQTPELAFISACASFTLAFASGDQAESDALRWRKSRQGCCLLLAVSGTKNNYKATMKVFSKNLIELDSQVIQELSDELNKREITRVEITAHPDSPGRFWILITSGNETRIFEYSIDVHTEKDSTDQKFTYSTTTTETILTAPHKYIDNFVPCSPWSAWVVTSNTDSNPKNTTVSLVNLKDMKLISQLSIEAIHFFLGVLSRSEILLLTMENASPLKSRLIILKHVISDGNAELSKYYTSNEMDLSNVLPEKQELYKHINVNVTQDARYKFKKKNIHERILKFELLWPGTSNLGEFTCEKKNDKWIECQFTTQTMIISTIQKSVSNGPTNSPADFTTTYDKRNDSYVLFCKNDILGQKTNFMLSFVGLTILKHNNGDSIMCINHMEKKSSLQEKNEETCVCMRDRDLFTTVKIDPTKNIKKLITYYDWDGENLSPELKLYTSEDNMWHILLFFKYSRYASERPSLAGELERELAQRDMSVETHELLLTTCLRGWIDLAKNEVLRRPDDVALHRYYTEEDNVPRGNQRQLRRGHGYENMRPAVQWLCAAELRAQCGTGEDFEYATEDKWAQADLADDDLDPVRCGAVWQAASAPGVLAHFTSERWVERLIMSRVLLQWRRLSITSTELKNRYHIKKETMKFEVQHERFKNTFSKVRDLLPRDLHIRNVMQEINRGRTDELCGEHGITPRDIEIMTEFQHFARWHDGESFRTRIGINKSIFNAWKSCCSHMRLLQYNEYPFNDIYRFILYQRYLYFQFVRHLCRDATASRNLAVQWQATQNKHRSEKPFPCFVGVKQAYAKMLSRSHDERRHVFFAVLWKRLMVRYDKLCFFRLQVRNANSHVIFEKSCAKTKLNQQLLSEYENTIPAFDDYELFKQPPNNIQYEKTFAAIVSLIASHDDVVLKQEEMQATEDYNDENKFSNKFNGIFFKKSIETLTT